MTRFCLSPILLPQLALSLQIGDGVPAIHVDKIAGCTDARVVMNVHGSWPNHALALGMDKDPARDQFFEFVSRFQAVSRRVGPRRFARPGKRSWSTRTSNLYDLLPLFRLNRGDGGYYIDKACIVSAIPTIGTMTTSRTSAATGCR